MNGLKLLTNSNFSYWILLLLFALIALVIGNICYEVVSKLNAQSFLDHFSDLLTSISITFFNNIIATILAIIIAFLITNYLYNKKFFKSSFLIILISFPHISYCIGITYLFATSGFFARLFAFFYGNDIPFISERGDASSSLIYIISLALREVPFLVLIGLSVLKKINALQIQKQVLVLGHSNLSALLCCIFPIWLKSMGLPILIIVTFCFSNYEFSSILGPQFPHMINVKIIESWYSTNFDLIQQMNSLIIITILSSILALTTLYILMQILIGYLKNKKFSASSNYNLFLLGKIFYFMVIAIFTTILFITSLLSIGESWFFPTIIPSNFSLRGFDYMVDNYLWLFFSSILISSFISILCLSFIVILIETSKETKSIYKFLFTISLMILVMPQNIMLISITSLMEQLTFFSVSFWFYFSLFIYIVPYTYFMMKQSYVDLNPQYIHSSDILGITRFKSFFLIKLPMMFNDFLLIFGVSFSVCFYQFLQGIIVTKGEQGLFNNEVFILFSGESIQTASAGSMMNFLPAALIFIIISLRYRYVRV